MSDCVNCATGWADGPLCRVHANDEIVQLREERDRLAEQLRIEFDLRCDDEQQLVRLQEGGPP